MDVICLSVAVFWPLLVFAYLSFGRLQKHQTIVFLLVEAILFLSLPSRLLLAPSFRSVQRLDFFNLSSSEVIVVGETCSGAQYTCTQRGTQHSEEAKERAHQKLIPPPTKTISSPGYKKNECDKSDKYRTMIAYNMP